MRAKILLLDDLGSDPAIASSSVANVIAERHAEERTTWITTGLTHTKLHNDTGAASRDAFWNEPLFFDMVSEMRPPAMGYSTARPPRR